MNADSLDAARERVLDRMDRANRMVQLAMLGGALAEAVLFAVAFLSVDWHNRLERLLFIFSVLSYSILVLGLVALGAHVTRVGARILMALDTGVE